MRVGKGDQPLWTYGDMSTYSNVQVLTSVIQLPWKKIKTLFLKQISFFPQEIYYSVVV